jgi:MarR family transcriptional regulator, 2-MHQ and catechol-resistance regulon repressor
VSEDRREAFYHKGLRQWGPSYPGFDLHTIETALSLLYTYDLFHQITGRYFAGFGLSKSTFNIMMLLRHGSPEGMLLHDLGELLLVSRANITGLVDHLEQKGYVKRVVDTQDRRARFARLTKKGEELLDRFLPVHFRNITGLLKDLTAKEKEMLIELLKKTRSSLTKNEAECAGYDTARPSTASRAAKLSLDSTVK